MNKFKLKNYHGTKPYSFSGKQTVYQFYPHESKESIDKKLQESNTFTKFKTVRKIKTNPYFIKYKRQLFQADLVFFTRPEQIRSNDGYKYILNVIDCFTRKIWVYKLKTKKCNEILKNFKKLFKECGKLPTYLQTDKGLEFICKELTQFLKENNVKQYFATSDRKCAFIERNNRTIQDILYRILDDEHSHRWIDFIDRAKYIYMNRIHSKIKMSPNDAELKENQSQILKLQHKHWASFKKKKPTFEIGDLVRISGLKNKFKRSYWQNFSDEIFVIDKILVNLPTPRYILREWGKDGEVLQDGTFLPNELSKVSKKVMDQEFKIEKVIKSVGKGSKKQILVKWLGWPEKFNSWIYETSIKRV